jgi:hypothetical protein
MRPGRMPIAPPPRHGSANIYNFIDVLVEIQSEMYIKCKSNGIKTKKVSEKEAFIRQQMTKLAQKKIEQFNFVKSLSFKILPNQ